MDSLNHDNQADVIEALNSTSRYIDDLLNIDRHGQSNLSWIRNLSTRTTDK